MFIFCGGGAKCSSTGFGLEFSYVFITKPVYGCNIPTPLFLIFPPLAAHAGTISATPCPADSFQQPCHMQVGGSLSITRIAEWEEYREVHPNHLICLCSAASPLATEGFTASCSLAPVSEDDCFGMFGHEWQLHASVPLWSLASRGGGGVTA